MRLPSLSNSISSRWSSSMRLSGLTWSLIVASMSAPNFTSTSKLSMRLIVKGRRTSRGRTMNPDSPSAAATSCCVTEP